MISGVFRRARGRVSANLFLADRATEYAFLLKTMAENGYVSLTVRDLAERVRDGVPLPERRVVLRHDIDSDPGYVDRWLALEARFGFHASYYFRLRTLDFPAMARVEAQGGEASYHYEELASVVRRNGRKGGHLDSGLISLARAEFEENFRAIQHRCNWRLRTVASHGDFVNRILGITNCIVVADAELRQRLGIEAEAYDEGIVRTFDARFADGIGEPRWRSKAGCDPHRALTNGISSIQVLTHPRHWRAHVAANLREDADRFVSGLFYSAGLPAGTFVDYVNKRRQLLG